MRFMACCALLLACGSRSELGKDWAEESAASGGRASMQFPEHPVGGAGSSGAALVPPVGVAGGASELMPPVGSPGERGKWTAVQTPDIHVFTARFYTDASWPQVWHSIWGGAPNSVWFAGFSVGYRTAIDHVWHWDGATLGLSVDGQEQPEKVRHVWGTSTTDVLGMGDLITRLDGSAWVRWEPADAIHHPSVDSVSGSSMSDIWLVSQGSVLHWNGAVWQTFMFSEARDVWTRSPEDTWVVGIEGTLRHWDGSGWSMSPRLNGIDLTAVWGNGSDDVWAVGKGIAHYAGPELGWRMTDEDGRPYVSGSDSLLLDVWGSARDDVWAVGKGGLVLHWDGLSWTRVFGFGEAELQVVWGNESDVWIGGDRVLYRLRR